MKRKLSRAQELLLQRKPGRVQGASVRTARTLMRMGKGVLTYRGASEGWHFAPPLPPDPPWYVDPVSGDDVNDGRSPKTALRTYAELRKRLTVNVIGDVP